MHSVQYLVQMCVFLCVGGKTVTVSKGSLRAQPSEIAQVGCQPLHPSIAAFHLPMAAFHLPIAAFHFHMAAFHLLWQPSTLLHGSLLSSQILQLTT